MSRVVADVAALAGALPAPVAQLLFDVSAPVERGLTAEPDGVRVLGGELVASSTCWKSDGTASQRVTSYAVSDSGV